MYSGPGQRKCWRILTLKKLKTIMSLILCLVFAFSFAACGSAAPSSGTDGEASGHTEPQNDTEEAAAVTGDKMLVIVFSATGNTKRVAEYIASYTGAYLYEIIPKELYTEEDLNWRDKNSRSSKEHSDPSFRPEIGSEDISLQGYSTVYIGYPIWWGEEPRIMDAFAEQHDFTGITVIPFCTSSSSGIGRSGINLSEKAGTGTWLEGMRFSEKAEEEEVIKWLVSLE